MGSKTSIEWTDATWNPVTGCTAFSDGCLHCYAEREAKRLQAMGNRRYANGFNLTLHDDLIDQPFKWGKPRRVFVCSMADLFHKDVPTEFIQRVFDTMEKNPRHTFQVLTKRAHRLRLLAPRLPWPSNIWAGVSVENDDMTFRVEHLDRVPAKVRFLSCEPLLGPLTSLTDFRHPYGRLIEQMQWVIVGGESGAGYRAMQTEWVRAIRDKCVRCSIPFFFKQWNGLRPKTLGRVLDGQEWNQFPDTEA